MESCVKILPTALQSILLHFALDVTQEMRGVLVGSLNVSNVFVFTVIPLPPSQDINCSVIESMCQDFSRTVGTQLGVVGWYHSHNELSTALTKQDIDFHLKFTAKFPNSVALVVMFGRRSVDQMARVMSFNAFRCDLNEKLVQVQCLVRPLLPNPLSSKFYAVACLALENILKIAEECVFSQKKEEQSYLDSAMLKPVLMTLQSMIASTNDL